MIPTAEKVIIPGTLLKASFRNEQERLEAFCRAMTISVQAGTPGKDGIGFAGKDGAPGPQSTRTTKSVDVATGESVVECGVVLEDANVNLVNATETPTIGILAVSGSRAFLTGAAPTGNYKIKITY